MNGLHAILFFTACFIFSFVIVAFAQETQQSGISAVLKQDPTKKDGSTETVMGQPRGLLDSLDFLNLRASNEHPDEDRIRIVSLYPQSLSAAKPEAYQTAPPRSYFFSLDDRGKENAYVGLANIDTEEKMERVYQRNLNTELLLGYQWGGFGSILFGRALQFEREGENVGRLTDMGWRIKFIKTF
ncbi:MAG: hypothetical protein ABSC55_16520 [Syntrophorhabdales bacterium]|jgi:hypothetical protein